LKKGIFYQEGDGSVWVNLEDAGMDRKIVLRSDGTSVYITQDIGTAQKRYADFGIDKMIYTVADEQDYHFKVLFEILKRFKEPYADGLYHLLYFVIFSFSNGSDYFYALHLTTFHIYPISCQTTKF